MSWYKKSAREMPIQEAIQIFGYPNTSQIPPVEEVKTKWKDFARKFHANQTPANQQTMARVNAAKDSIIQFLQSPRDNTGLGESGFSPPPREQPPWQTDERASYNEVGQDFSDINFSIKSIYDESIKHGDVRKVTFWAFDGHYIRGVFTAFANDATLGYGGDVMSKWNSMGGNPYPTYAVLASEEGAKDIKLVWLKDYDVSSQNISFSHDSFNNNPSNDDNFMNELRRYVANSGVDITA